MQGNTIEKYRGINTKMNYFWGGGLEGGSCKMEGGMCMFFFSKRLMNILQCLFFLSKM